MKTYTPFPRPVDALVPDDLALLRHVSEGWHVEYKREVPSADSIAKSVSALANTYGGWLFYGVEEKSKEEPTAGSYPGIKRDRIDAALQAMRQAVASLAMPSPHYETKVLWGPCEVIDLGDDRAVICVFVPWSPTTPHVHRSGRIYRRVADGSEPRPENDRFMLDQLWRRGDTIRKDYRRWIRRDPEFSKGEEDRPYLRLLLVADPWRDRGAWTDLSLADFRSVVGQEKGIVGAIPFDTVYNSAMGYTARQVGSNDPHNRGLTWRFRQDLVSEVILPLNYYQPSSPEILPYELEGYLHIQRFADKLKLAQHGAPRIVDINHLFSMLVGTVEIQERLAASAAWTGGFHMKARLLNVWRTIPFVDVLPILEGFGLHGVPMCLDSEVTTPAGDDPTTFVPIEPFLDGRYDQARILSQAAMMFGPIARAFGLPDWLTQKTNGEVLYLHEELLQASVRATAVQRYRKSFEKAD